MDHKHTFLFTEGTWNLKGYFFDENEKSFVAEGEVIIKHDEKIWQVSSRIKTLGNNPVDILNEYEVAPFKGNGKTAQWKAENSLIGEIKGSFVMHHEYIVSLFESIDKKHSGTEYLMFVDKSYYKYRGIIFRADRKYASWTLEMKLAKNE